MRIQEFSAVHFLTQLLKIWMKKFSPDQMMLVLILAAMIIGLTIYRIFRIF